MRDTSIAEGVYDGLGESAPPTLTDRGWVDTVPAVSLQGSRVCAGVSAAYTSVIPPAPLEYSGTVSRPRNPLRVPGRFPSLTSPLPFKHRPGIGYCFHMISLALAATAPETLPVWMMLIGMVLTGGSVAGVFQYLTKRNETKAGSSTVEATANLTGVESLSKVIGTLTEENTRLITGFDRVEKKLDASREQVAALQELIEARPNKEDLTKIIVTLRDQLRDVGETPTNGATNGDDETAKG